MQASTVWWIFVGLTMAAELLTGTIYLLMIGTGLDAGALAAHLGLDWPASCWGDASAAHAARVCLPAPTPI